MEPVTVTKAIDILATSGYPVSRVTLINWCRKYGLGKKIGGRWLIDKKLLGEYVDFIEGDNGKKKSS